MAFGIFQLSLVFTIGLYIALASDIAGAIGINEIPLSLSLKDPEDAVISREQNVVLKCEAKSSVPGLSISWFHENTPLLANDTRVQISGDGSLNISKTSAKKMEGSYRCLARNDVGAVLSNPAQLKIATIGREFIEQPDNVNTTEQQPVIFPCHIDSTPDAIIYWERDNKTLPQNARYVPLPSGALLITSTHSIDTGFYRCVVKHKTLKKTKQSRWGQLLVSPPSVTSSPPQFLPLNLSLNITSIVGENVTLPCAVNGWPIPVLRWVYNKDSLISNSSVLHLTNVTTDLSGNYSCIANNVFGEVSMNFTLNIFEIPHFNVTPMSMSYPSARMVRLECKVNGVPPPKVTWLKNGAPLELIGRIKQLNTTLVLSHSFMTDAGKLVIIIG
uniref:Ig-like domain-containing protein n=1 Tax=Photinus pyralis TaxID=7054 RepID=A0A1Y1L6M8_PHOPY